jgi:hypothetical protein
MAEFEVAGLFDPARPTLRRYSRSRLSRVKRASSDGDAEA